jgi:phosphoribosylformylglycinamidine synthase
VRNVVAVGATPWALTDCLNFGSPENPECMADLEACVEGLGDAARALGGRESPGEPLPFVSGNVSLYNESHAGRAIPPTPIVACFGVATDVARTRGMSLKQAGDLLLRVGPWSEALGGSLYAEVTGQQELLDSILPELDLEEEARRMRFLLDAFDAGLIRSCRDTNGGGTLLALLEMSFGRRGEPRLGMELRFAELTAARLFAEAPGYVCSVAADALRPFETLGARHGVVWERLGSVLPDPVLRLESDGESHEMSLEPLAHRWCHGLHDVILEEVAR